MASGRTKLLGLHPEVKAAAEWAIAWADYYGVPVTITSGARSMAEQATLRRNYERCVSSGRFGQGPDCLYPANRPGESAHNFGLAFDSVVPAELMPWWLEVRRLAGFHVLPEDLPHAEVPGWRGFV